MPNIAITAYCNLKCPYCFADDMICEQSHNITIEKFREILSWVARTPENHIGIIGGEPTIHPKFSDILKEVNQYCRELQTSATLFTNGIYLDKYLAEIGNSTGILINCNAPDNMTADQWTRFNATLEHLHLLDWFHPGQERANVGCNIYMARTDYTYIWQIIDKYNIKRLRTSVTSPTPEFRGDKEEYFTKLKPIFMDFVEKALERQIILGMDCSQIPNCYFTQEEMEKVLQVMPEKNNPNYCEPVIDITPEFTATACFGCYDPVDCTQFPTVIDLRRYLLHRKNYPRMVGNATGKCAGCPNHELMLCQGGCLGFADMNRVQLLKDTVNTLNAGGGVDVRHSGNPDKVMQSFVKPVTKYAAVDGVQPGIAILPAEEPSGHTCSGTCSSCSSCGQDTPINTVGYVQEIGGDEIARAGDDENHANATRICIKDCNACTNRCGAFGMYAKVKEPIDAVLIESPDQPSSAAPMEGQNSFGENLTNMTMTPAPDSGTAQEGGDPQ